MRGLVSTLQVSDLCGFQCLAQYRVKPWKNPTALSATNAADAAIIIGIVIRAPIIGVLKVIAKSFVVKLTW